MVKNLPPGGHFTNKNEKALLLCATQYITTAAPCYFVMRAMRVIHVMRAILPRARNLHIYAPEHA